MCKLRQTVFSIHCLWEKVNGGKYLHFGKSDRLAVPSCHPQCRRSYRDPRRLSMAGGNLSGHGVVSSQTGGGADNVFRCFENLRSQYLTIYDWRDAEYDYSGHLLLLCQT